MITITTDFGYEDHYVGVMKGVILNTAPGARIVDITHGVRRHDVRHAAYVLRAIVDYFPDAVHLFVVDPGVGTARRGIVARLDRGYFVGPDNGILTLVADRVKKVWSIQIEPKSTTFHGRDVFAPAAALVELNDFSRFGLVDGFEKYVVHEPELSDGKLTGEVIHIDHFGNVVTNIPGHMVPEVRAFRYSDRVIPFVSAYGNVSAGAVITLVNSENFLELAVNQGSAAEKLGLKVGSKINLEIID